MEPAQSNLSLLRAAIGPVLLGLAAGGLCYLSAGPGLGLCLGSVGICAVMVPPIAAGRRRAVDAVLAAAGFGDAVGLIWLIALLRADGTFVQWLECYLVLAGFVLALAGAAWIGRRVIGSIFGGAVVVVLALAWLLWPVWLAGHLSGASGAATVSWLTPAHPLLAINHVLLDQGIWTQQRLMYQHTALGQDLAYALPHSIWPSVVIHAAIGLVLLWAGGFADRKPGFARPGGSLPTPTDA